eukprot:CAMPEP_0115528590 /NCGR_PEP_ID=MMETSP0271-20121206/83475_1 /TAXON_ID=71861 /ORGANISM="Scrippsiella trochoidea, Strain CCMP3099" /LENGTH=185 /DNA_ID=CAMNT_0002960527 /DNA_START=45 /DNA_END=602 /DNA_ORIENTATION=+
MADKAVLVQQVKDWQRMSKGHKESWDRFVKKRDRSETFDPNRHDVSLLEEFLTAAHGGQIEIPDVPDDGGGKSWGKGKGGYKGWGGGGGGWGGKGGGMWGSPWDMMSMMQQMWNYSGGDASSSYGTSSNGQEMKPGDWICPSCSNLNFARRNECKMCGTERPADSGGKDAGGKDAGGKGKRYSPY